jgi:hypothetical protein
VLELTAMAMPMPLPPQERPEVRPLHEAPARLSPDEEAMQLMLKLVERAAVAKSFAKIAAGIFSVTATRATVQLRAVADAKMAETIEREGGLRSQVDKVRKIARAAKDAAVHVATHRPQPEAQPEKTGGD